MRKLAILMSVLLVAALAGTASAGLNTDINGNVAAEIYYDQQEGITARGKAIAKITMSAGNDGPIKAVVDLAATEAKNASDGHDGDWAHFTHAPFEGNKALELKINSAYIQTEGPFIKGMPGVTTKFGKFGANFSNWIGEFGSKNAIEVSGLDLGVGALSAYSGWDGEDHRINAVKVSANIDVVNVNGAYVRTTDLVDDDIYNDFAIEASIKPVDGLDVNAAFASEGEHQASAYKVGATLSTIPNLTLGAETWNTASNFEPQWPHRDDDGNTTAFTKDSKGFKLSASTEQAGITLGLNYKSENNIAETNPVNVTELTASTNVSGLNLSGKVAMKTENNTAKPTFIQASVGGNFSGVDASYTLDINPDHNEKVVHTLSASTTVDTPIADGVRLAGKLILDEKDAIPTKFAADATWTAPNGFNLGLHYANFDRGTDQHGWSGKDIKNNSAGADGFVVKAGISVDF